MNDKVKEIGEVVLDFHELEGEEKRTSPFSDYAIGQFPVKEPAPSAPVITDVYHPEGTSGTFEVKIDLPTTNEDGSVLAPAELVKMRLHYSSTSGVDIEDPYSEFAPSGTIDWAPNIAEGKEIFFAIRVMDSHGSWSELSNEESGIQKTIEVPDPDIWAHRISNDSIFTDDSPQAGHVAWSNVTLIWKDERYEITDGSTEDPYVWWSPTQENTFQTSETPPELTKDDTIIGFNDQGKWRLMVYHPMVIADYLRAGYLQSGNWGEEEGSEFDLWEGELKLGGYSDPSFSVNKEGVLTAVDAIISGTISISSNSSGWANLTDKPTELSDLNETEGTKLKGIEDYATEGADWDENVANKPETIIDEEVPPGAGLFLSPYYMGFHDATSWKTFMDNSGNFYLGGTDGSLQWDAGEDELTIQGIIKVESGGWLGGTNAVTIDSEGLDVGDSGRIKGGATGFESGIGFWLGREGFGEHRFYVGNEDNDQYMSWDGSTLTVRGDIEVDEISANNITSGSLAGQTITGGTIRTAASGWRTELSDEGDYPLRYWNGTTTRFSVDDEGSVFVSGQIEISQGWFGGTNSVTVDSDGLDVGSSGRIQGGDTNIGFESGTGFWLGQKDFNDYRFYIGNKTADNYLSWNGSTNTLVVRGDIEVDEISADNITSGSLAGQTITGGTIQTATPGWGVWRVTLTDEGDYPLRYWDGFSTRFSVDDEGNVFVSGQVEIGQGNFGGSGVITVDSDGLDVGTEGRIKGGANDFEDGTGFWIGRKGFNTYKLYVGNKGGFPDHYLSWDGETLVVRGDIVTNAVDVGETGYIKGGQTDFHQGTGFWMGHKWNAHVLSIGEGEKDPTTASEFRIFIENNHGDPNFISIYDVRLFDNGNNIATGQSYDASSEYSGYPPENAFDEDTDTAWATNIGDVTDQWISIDFSSDKTITGFSIWGRDLSQTPKNIKFQAKIGGNWETVFEKTIERDDTYQEWNVEPGHYLTWDGSKLTAQGDVVAKSVDVGNEGEIKGGKWSYGLGSGFWIGWDEGDETYKFDIGSATKYMRWTGEELDIKDGTFDGGDFGDGNFHDGTITSSLFRTAESGERAELLGGFVSHGLAVWDDSSPAVVTAYTVASGHVARHADNTDLLAWVGPGAIRVTDTGGSWKTTITGTTARIDSDTHIIGHSLTCSRKIRAEDFTTSSEVPDMATPGRALDKLENIHEWKRGDEIQHEKHYACIEDKDEEGNLTGYGLSMGKRISTMERMIYELWEEVKELRADRESDE